ncbi:hypothetical protein VNO80_01310 [Phaseolus coccineus]|uniref:Uncharacterized protein n=1 Tax=Phaseolus coccineus TaxID=3886 RepID=A0AAN9RSM6_PHACN
MSEVWPLQRQWLQMELEEIANGALEGFFAGFGNGFRFWQDRGNLGNGVGLALRTLKFFFARNSEDVGSSRRSRREQQMPISGDFVW